MEQKHLAFRCASVVFPVASSRGLNLAFKARVRSVHSREIKINSRFDQARGHNPACLSVFQPFFDLIEDGFSVLRNHKCGQMIGSSLRQPIKNVLRLLSGRHDTQHLIQTSQTLRQFIVTQLLLQLHIGDPSERREQIRGVPADFRRPHSRTVLLKKRFQRRLRGRTEHAGSAVISHQLRDGRDTRLQKTERYGLRLIENDDTVRDIMQFPAG